MTFKRRDNCKPERGTSRPAARRHAPPSQERNTETATLSKALRAGTSRAPMVVPRSAQHGLPSPRVLAFRFVLNLLALLIWLSFPATGAEHRLDPRTPEGLREL